MAARKQRPRAGGRSGKRRAKPSQPGPLSKKEKRDLLEFGEAYPSALRQAGKNERFQKVTEPSVLHEEPEPSEEDSSEAEDAYEELIRSVHGDTGSASHSLRERSISSSSDSGSSDEVAEIAADDDRGIESQGSNVAVREEASTDDDDAASSELSTDGAVEAEGVREAAQDLSASMQGQPEDKEAEEEDDEADHRSAPADDKLDPEDPFCQHFEVDLDDKQAASLAVQQSWQQVDIKIPALGQAAYHCVPALSKTTSADMSKPALLDHCMQHVRPRARDLVTATQRKHVVVLGAVTEKEQATTLSALQKQLLSVMNSYVDLFYPCRIHTGGEQIRLVYCLHTVNHILKTRSRVLANAADIKSKTTVSDDNRFRDQGLTRPKVLILLPTRNAALRCIQMIVSLLMPKRGSFVGNMKRFLDDYGNSEEEGATAKKLAKPDDHQAIFSGNTDDCFRIGLSIAKKGMKLYTDFYLSDIILASPLGLRTVVGAEGEESRDFDFLSSIEVLILDQADMFLMQNWDHVLHVFNHLHLQPKESHDVDFSRVRMWNINGWSKYYRQTLIFSNIASPELSSIYSKHCCNYAGKLRVATPQSGGSICHIVAELPQVYHKISAPFFSELSDVRFNYFIKKVLPDYRSSVRAHTLIFIPSYFDYVRIRNYFKKEGIDAVLLCEYSKDSAISKGRSDFFHGRVPFMLYTERLHYYRRFIMRGVRHLIFYGLPHYSNFYSEICNTVRDVKHPELSSGVMADTSCLVLYSKFEAMFLAEIVGTERASRMITSDRDVHMLVTGDL